MAERVIVEVDVAAPAGRVFAALREPREVARWFGWQHADLESEIRFIFEEDARVIEPGRVLHMPGIETTFALEPRASGTRLRVSKPGGPTGDAPYDEIEEGWVCFMQQLRFALERRPGEERRTIRVATPSHVMPDGEPFGPFASIARKPVGESYQLDAGEPIAGTVWFVGRYQLGLRIEGRHEALLMVGRTPTQAIASAILTTYGLTDPELDALRARWSAWWDAASGAGRGG